MPESGEKISLDAESQALQAQIKVFADLKISQELETLKF